MSKIHSVALVTPLVLMLTACASAPEKEQQLQAEVQELTQKVEHLNTQTALLDRQVRLNANSDNGVYLLAGANADAQIMTAIGQLRVRLDHVEPEAGGSKAVLQIKNATGAVLPGFSAILNWGKLNPATGEPSAGDALAQTLTFSPPLVATNVTSMEVRLSDITPEELGFVHLHDVRQQ